MKRVKVKLGLIMCFLALSFSSFSQSLSEYECDVVSVIHLAQLDYAILQRIGTQEYFETSPYISGELNLHQKVTLMPTRNDNYLVGSNTLTENVYAWYINYGSGTSLSVIRLPRLENGILFFDDKAQYDNIYNLIDEYMNQGDYDEMLDRIEATTIGFTSFRTWFNNTYDRLNGVHTIEELRAISKLDFIGDDIIKTLINQDRLMGIGDTIYQYSSTSVILKFHKSNQDAINFLSTKKLDYDITNEHPITLRAHGIIVKSNNIGYINLPVNPDDIGGGMENILGSTLINDSPTYDSIRYTSSIVVDNVGPDMCDPLTKSLRISMMATYYFHDNNNTLDSISNIDYPLSGSTIIIDWKEYPTNIQTLTNYNSNSDINHTFPASSVEETYKPIVTINFVDFDGVNRSIEDGYTTDGQEFKFVVGNLCVTHDYTLPKDTISQDGNYMIECRVWIHDNIFGNHVGSYTWSYEKVGNGWNLNRGDIWCLISGTFYDFDCYSTSTKYGTKHKSNSKKVQKVKTKLKHYIRHEDGSVLSGHYLNTDGDNGGEHLEKSLNLVYCQ